MLTASPAHVRVHYQNLDGAPTTFTGALCADQHDGRIGITPNAAVWQDPAACRWQMGWDRITRVEILDPGTPEPSVMAQLLHAAALTPNQRAVFTAIADAGGTIGWRELFLALPDMPTGYVANAVQALIAKGRAAITHHTSADTGYVHLN